MAPRKYCSNRCVSEPTRVLTCPRCGKEFKAGKQKRVYCSHACKNPNSRTQDCRQCGKTFRCSPGNRRKFCSYECHLASGGARRAGFAAVRAKALYGLKKDANHNEVVRTLKKCGIATMDTSGLGCGFPDLIVTVKGQIHLVDIKNPNTSYGRRGLNDLQKEFADNWQGPPIYLIYSMDDVASLVAGRFDKLKSAGGYKPAERPRLRAVRQLALAV
jgi:hypothetical protein